jgi:APA family basic amino acid/polyamine antiporter
VQGQMPMALAQDQLLPAVFAKKNQNDTPALSIIISSVFITLLLLFNQSKNFSNLYSFMILLTAVTVLVSYLSTALVYAYFSLKGIKGFQWTLKSGLYSIIGIGFSVWMIIGSGLEATLWGAIGLLLGIPIYLWKKKKQ